MTFVPLTDIALQPNAGAVMARAIDAAHRICEADAAFVALRDDDGHYRVRARLGLREPEWDRIIISTGRGMGGQVVADRGPRASDDYLRDPTITADFVPLVAREAMHGVAVVPIADLSAADGASRPLGLLYVTRARAGAPGDCGMTELHRAGEMTAVGFDRVGVRGPLAPSATSLTVRELEVLRLLADGCSNADIARRLVVSEPTTKTHVRRILRKLGVPSRLAAVAEGRRRGLVD